MEVEVLKKILAETAKRCCEGIKEKRYYNLIYSNNRVREPELRDILSKVLCERHVNYGIEVPTIKRYSFSGRGKRRARIDLSICEGNEPIIHIELKSDTPQIDKIQKDFQKLMLEKIGDVCLFHVLHNSDAGTIPQLKENYKDAYDQAKKKVGVEAIEDKPFLLYVFIASKNKAYVLQEDISKIKNFDNLKEVNS